MRPFFVMLCFSAAALTSPALGQTVTYDARWNDATKQPGAEVSEYRDFKVVVCCEGLTYFYFTKPSHPAHPGVIKRAWANEDGKAVSHIDGWSYASDAAQPTFKAWLSQIQELDDQARVAIGGPSQEAMKLVGTDKAFAYASRCTALAASMNQMIAEYRATGKIGPADVPYVEPFAKLEAAATSDLGKRIANLGPQSPTRADIIGASEAVNAKTAGGSRQVAQDCWSHYNIRVGAGF